MPLVEGIAEIHLKPWFSPWMCQRSIIQLLVCSCPVLKESMSDCDLKCCSGVVWTGIKCSTRYNIHSTPYHDEIYPCTGEWFHYLWSNSLIHVDTQHALAWWWRLSFQHCTLPRWLHAKFSWHHSNLCILIYIGSITCHHLTSAATNAGLNPGQLNAYCNWHVGVGHSLVGAARGTSIAQAIGCKVMLEATENLVEELGKFIAVTYE